MHGADTAYLALCHLCCKTEVPLCTWNYLSKLSLFTEAYEIFLLPCFITSPTKKKNPKL